MSITFGGLATGLDSAAIVRNLTSLERRPIDRLQQRKQTLGSQRGRLSTLASRLRSLKDAAEAVGAESSGASTTVRSSDEGVVRTTSLGAATAGTSEVRVTQLAQAQRTFSDGFAAPDVAGIFGAGTLEVQVGGSSYTVEVTSDDTLTTLASKLNGAGAPLRASLVFDGTGHRLRVAGTETGASQAIAFVEGAGLGLGLGRPENTTQSARDALFTIDGLAMQRGQNIVDDALPGVRLTLTGVSAPDTSAQVLVERDDASAIARVQKLVEAYNEANRLVAAELAPGTPGAPRADSLSGDSALRSVQSGLRAMLGHSNPAGPPGFRTLADLGIQVDRTGMLSLDSAKLERGLASDPEGVRLLLSGDGSSVEGFATRLSKAVDGLVASPDGVIPGRIRTLEGRSRDIDKQVDRLELRLAKTEELLNKQFASLERVVSGLQTQGNQMLAALSGLVQR